MQTPEDFHTFTTSCIERLPLLHLILRASPKQYIQKVLDFLKNIPDLYKVSNNVSSDGRKAGHYYATQAQTILCEAAKHDNNLRTVLALINADTMVDDPERDFSPLMLAAGHGSTEVIKALIDHGVSVDRCNSRNETSLLIACRHKQWDAAKLLYDNGANVFIKNKDNKCAFNIAKEEHGVSLLQYMAEKVDDIRQRLMDSISLSDACQYGYDLVANSYDIGSLSAAEIKDAATKSCVSRSTIILEHFSPKLDDHSLCRQITQAYESGHCDCVDVLLKCCARRENMPCPKISLAETCKNVKFINLTYFLIEKGQDVNRDLGEPLRNAVEHGNTNAVKYLLQFGAQGNMVNTKGVSPLLLACERNHVDIVEILLNYTADINIETNQKETPLIASCKLGNLQAVNLLLSRNPSPNLNKQNQEGKTALEVAIDNYHSAIVVALDKKGAHLPLQHASHKDVQFLQKLCRVGCVHLIEMYLSCENEGIGFERRSKRRKQSEKMEINEQLFNIVIRAENKDLLQLLLKSDKLKTMKKTIVSALKCACMTGSVDIVKMIIQRNKRNWKTMQNENESHLYVAIQYENAPLVSLLVDNGCVPGADCPINASFRSKDILCLLLKYDVPVASINATLMAVCKAGHRTAEFCARQLLDKSADVNYQDMDDPDHLTVLLASILKQSISLVTLLLERGADPNLTDNKGRSPLFVACDLGHHELASLLLYNEYDGGSADPNLPSAQSEKSALRAACMRGHLDLVNLLISNKANPDLIDQDGCHLVPKAHKDGHYEVVRLLLECGADPSALNGVLDLQESCRLGYFEHVQSVHQDKGLEELKMGIREACQSGYPETAMGIIINIIDESRQLDCYNVLKDVSRDLPITETVSHEVTQSREDNLLWQCFCRNDQTQMAELIKDGENPNISNGRGTPLLHACMQNKMTQAVFALCNCPKIDINQKDEVGRTVLFYTLDWFMVMNNGKGCCMFDYLLHHGAKVLPDDFGRTLLHAWQTVPSGGGGVTLQKLLSYCVIHQGDFKGQTALHLAVLENNPVKVRELLEAGSNPEALDINEISSLELAEQNSNRTLCKMLSERCSVSRSMSDAIDQSNTEPQNVHFSNEHKMEHRVTGALHKLFHEANQKASCNQFMEKYKMPVLISDKAEFIREFKSFRSTILAFMKDIGSIIAREDPLFGFEPVLSGSCSEGTKVTEMNEADVLCWFQHTDWQSIKLATHETDNYAYMKVESTTLAANHPALFKDNHLSVYGVFQRFYALVRRNVAHVLRQPEYRNLYISDTSRILQSDNAICPLQLVWSGEFLKWQEFSLDVVPAIPVDIRMVPGELNHHDLIHDLYMVPKWTASLLEKEYADMAFQFGFSRTESDFLLAMPDALRQGYKLTKAVLHDCLTIDDVPASEFLSSYMLKCKTFECFTDMPDSQQKLRECRPKDLIDRVLQPPNQLIQWADKILGKIDHHIAIRHFESFFLPGSDLFGHPRYKKDHRPLIYTRLCRAMLHSPSENIDPWARLAQAVADQLCKPENLLRDKFIVEIEMLREMGLDANYRSENGCNLMFFMIKNDLLNGVQNLIEWGTSVWNVDGQGSSALDTVNMNMNQTSIVYLLKEALSGKYTEL